MRTYSRSDIPQLLAIENSVHIAPWTDDSFKACFQAGYLGWVIEVENKIIAFLIASLTAEECHILNVCVARESQHQGHGRALMEQALEHARKKQAQIAYLEVRRTNDRAINLYQKMQFHLIGERKGYYPTVSGPEDALIFAMTLRNSSIV